MSGQASPLPEKKLEQPAGSPIPGEPEFLVIGKLRRPHGIRGEILMDVLTDFPERLEAGMTVFIGEDHRPQRIAGLRNNNREMLLTLEGFYSPEDVGIFRNELVYVRVADRPELEEGEFYHHQLIGMRVVLESGAPLGTLVEILVTGANDVYVVQPEAGPEILLPAIADVILDIDLEHGQMRVQPLPGLID
jgi:16S rRNA processing protein RimM